MYCPKCGKKLKERAKFCTNCSYAVPGTSQVDVPINRSKGKAKWPIIIALVILLILIILVPLVAVPVVNRMRYQSFLKTGNRYLTEMNYDEAVVSFTKAIRIEEKEAAGYYGRGNAYFGLAGQAETEDDMWSYSLQAEEDYYAALDLDEMMTDAYETLSEVYLAWDDLDSALDILEFGYEVTGERKLSEKAETVREQVTADNDNERSDSAEENADINNSIPDDAKSVKKSDDDAGAEAKTLMSGSDDEYVFKSTIDKRAIKNIIFLDSLDHMPSDAWDISAGGDGSVWAWVEICEPGTVNRGYEGEWYILYIAGDGGVNAGKNCKSLFSGYQNMETIDFNDCFHTENVTDMSSMFKKCASLKELDLSSFDTSRVQNMESMFKAGEEMEGKDFDSSLKKINLSNFNTSQVTNMKGMFFGCILLEELDVGSFDTSQVKNMASMFYGCESLSGLHLSNFDTSQVDNMAGMFMFCFNLQELNISSFNTSRVTSMSSMFWQCERLQELDVSNFDTSKVTDMGSMFRNCSSLQELDISNFDTSQVTNMRDMFNGCRSLQSLDTSALDMSNVQFDIDMFKGTRLELSGT
ncbi:MAG: BspA family leucine-rich repeat surface protein [Clostridiales bacterium]|nr:BspA family leucine-rich repeat surface protein [Clostridiales bacterium]